ncbi:MAG: two-component regulator propeller domain-containing protein [Acidobacteriota bacterium]
MRVSKELPRSVRLVRSRRLSIRLALANLALFCWAPGPAQAQAPSLYFKNLSLEDGLSQRTAWAVLQDQKGYLWIGTQEGLNRWDGRDFVTLTRDSQDPGSLPNSEVRCLAEDASGTLWVGTPQGIARLSAWPDRFERFPQQTGDGGDLSGTNIRDLLFEENGSLWVATSDGGVDLLDVSTGAVRRVLASPGEAPIGGVYRLAPGRSGGLWLGLDDGVAHLEAGASFPERVLPREITERIYALHQDERGVLWIGTEKGLLQFDPSSRELKTLLEDPDRPLDWLPSSAIRDIEPAAVPGDLWIATGRGLAYYQATTGRFFVYRHVEGDPSTLAHDSVVALFLNQTGLLFVGTESAGFDRVLTSAPFETVAVANLEQRALIRSETMTFAEDAEGGVWVGLRDGEVFRTDRDGQFLNQPAALRGIKATKMLFDSAGSLWIGTRRDGLFQKPPGSPELRSYRHIPGDPESLPAAGVVAILEDSRGRLWVGTFRGGLGLLDRESGKFRVFRHDKGDPASISGDLVVTLAEGANGLLWVGIHDGGLNRLDPETGLFERFPSRPGDATSLPEDSVMSLALDSQQRLWVGTYGSGLAMMTDDRRGGTFRTWTTRDGLPRNSVAGVEIDARDRVWISTNQGIARVEPATDTVRVFKSRHGLPSVDFLTGASLIASNGDLYFGGPGGVTIVDPSRSLAAQRRTLPVYLTSLKIGEREVAADGAAGVGSWRVGHRERTLEIAFLALDLAAPQEIEYRYRLDGFDDHWIDMGRRRPVTYTNLDPGEYVFRAAACSADGVCNEDSIRLSFDVEAPPWKTWWAQLSYALLGFALVFGSIRWRVTALKRRSSELEELVLQRTSELSETVERLKKSEFEATSAQRRALKSLEEALEERRRAQEANRAKSTFLSNMSHELRTPLNAMLGFAQLMERDSALDADHQESLGSILRSGEHLLGLINDVLSLSKIEAGKLSLASETFEPRRVLRSVEEMTAGRAEQKGLELLVLGADQLPRAVRGDSGRLAQVLINLLSNAVKFTESGRIELRIRWSEEVGSFDIEDTGVGIAPRDVETLFQPFVQSADGAEPKEGTGLGLPISKRLVEMMGGELQVWSELNKGSIFSFSIPLPEAASPPQPRRRRLPASGLALSQDPPRILVVDDAEENRRLLMRLLGGVGIYVREAADGLEATELWANWRPHLIFMDIRMPRMDGYEATRRIRQREAEGGAFRTLIIALTATAFEHDRRRILAAGCDDVVTKPFQEELLFDKISEHLDVACLYGEATGGPEAVDPHAAGALSQPAAGAFRTAERSRLMRSA